MRLISPPSLLLPGLCLALLSGCGTTRQCADNTDYLQARDRPKLQMPEGVMGSERIGGLAIPPVDPDPVRLDPVPRCLDEPPSFFGRRGATAGVAADAVEDVVIVWATAWADRKPDAVAAMYSSQFEVLGEGGAAAIIEQRREQVRSGKAPDARIDDIDVTTVGADRRVVSFVQRFGDAAVRKELTLVREAQGWRIVSERTLDVL
jgi:hypothetical protein